MQCIIARAWRHYWSTIRVAVLKYVIKSVEGLLPVTILNPGHRVNKSVISMTKSLPIPMQLFMLCALKHVHVHVCICQMHYGIIHALYKYLISICSPARTHYYRLISDKLPMPGCNLALLNTIMKHARVKVNIFFSCLAIHKCSLWLCQHHYTELLKWS